MEIRLLNADDAGEWLRLRLEALQTDPAAFSASLEEYELLSLEEVKRRLWSTADAFVTGAFEQNRLVGVAGFYREQGIKSRHKGRVWGVYVTASKRGQGVGRRIMLALLEHAAAIPGIQQVLLSVTSTQLAALALYRSLGFEEFGTEPRALNLAGRFIDECHMILLDEPYRQLGMPDF
ncbi:MAG TPA: GNAT family protein [Candidatus Binatia bacterium]|nr:GNAT family protein [Candidatus Binatia bacterium]